MVYKRIGNLYIDPKRIPYYKRYKIRGGSLWNRIKTVARWTKGILKQPTIRRGIAASFPKVDQALNLFGLGGGLWVPQQYVQQYKAKKMRGGFSLWGTLKKVATLGKKAISNPITRTAIKLVAPRVDQGLNLVGLGRKKRTRRKK